MLLHSRVRAQTHSQRLLLPPKNMVSGWHFQVELSNILRQVLRGSSLVSEITMRHVCELALTNLLMSC